MMLTAEERFENLHKQLKHVDDYLVKLLNENNELKARNEELEKELELCQADRSHYIYANKIFKSNGKELENENMMLKTKLAMYEELDKVKDKYTGALQFHNTCVMHKMDDLIFEAYMEMVKYGSKEQELEEQIKSLDKKCDGECEI